MATGRTSCSATSVPLGVMGYVVASMELRQQFDELKIEPDWICVTSMGVTQAGLVLGRELLGESYSVTGLAYQSTGGMGARWVSELAQGAAGLLGLPLVIDADAVVNDDREGGRGVRSDDRSRAGSVRPAASGPRACSWIRSTARRVSPA